MLLKNSPLVFILLALISTCTEHTLHQRTGVTGISVHVHHCHRKFKITNASWASGLRGFTALTNFPAPLYRDFTAPSLHTHLFLIRGTRSQVPKGRGDHQSHFHFSTADLHSLAFLPLLHEPVSSSDLSPECQLTGSVPCDRDSRSQSPSGRPSALPTPTHSSFLLQ